MQLVTGHDGSLWQSLRHSFRRQSQRWLLLVLLIATGLPASGEPDSTDPPHDSSCVLCEGGDWLECRRCETKGTTTASCGVCSGTKKVHCRFRGSIGEGENRFPLACDKGKISCINCLGSGKINWKVGPPDPCRVCTRGKVPCPYCNGKAKIPCSYCSAKGKVTGVCEACLGMRHYPCPSTQVKSACKACRDKKKISCPSCLGRKRVRTLCKECYGLGLDLCGECFAGRAICDKCSGSGKLRYTSGGRRAGTEKCDRCRTRGWAKCSHCKAKGHNDCSPFEESKRCKGCRENPGHTPCPVCQG